MHIYENKDKKYRLRLDLILTVMIICLLIGFFLNTVKHIQRQIEQQNMQTQLQHFRLGIAEKWIHLKTANQTLDIDAIENSNPMHFIIEPPDNYIGELAQSPQDSNSVWYYNTNTQRLIYVTSDHHEWSYAFVKAKQNRALTNIGLDLIALNSTH